MAYQKYIDVTDDKGYREIKRLALIEIGLERPESTLEEREALHCKVQLPSVSQEATSLGAW